MTPRVRRLWAVFAVLGVALGGVAADAAHRRARPMPSEALVSLLGLPDLALSSTARWLRHPSQTEPAAPFADAPATLDTEPAGSVIGPPVQVLGHGARPWRRR